MSPCWQDAYFISKRCNCSLISLVERKTKILENRKYWGTTLVLGITRNHFNYTILVLYGRSFLIIGAILTKSLSHDNVQITYDAQEPFHTGALPVRISTRLTSSVGRVSTKLIIGQQEIAVLTLNIYISCKKSEISLDVKGCYGQKTCRPYSVGCACKMA